MTAGQKGGIDPGLKAILDSIRQTVAGDLPAEAGAAAEAAEDAPVAPAPARPPLRANLPPSDKTVEEFLADLIRPQVDAWLATHLPEIVQKLAADEIRRLTGGK